MSVFSRSGFSAKNYASFRPSYPSTLYSKILSLVASSSSTDQATTTTVCLDLGCGHGVASAAFSPHFTRVIGIDPSSVMIAQAQSQHAGSNIEFQTGPAEDLDSIPDASVDLAVSAQAAHWFDWNRAWPQLARVVKPGGTLAFWGYKDNVILGHPEANKIFERFIYGHEEVSPGVEGLGSHWEQPGRNILRNLYRSIEPPSVDWESITRSEHEAGEDHSDELGWILRKTMKLGSIESYFRTYSSYKAWQDVNEGKPDVFNIMWKQVLDAEEDWKKQDDWRDTTVETDWGTCLLTAKRR